MNGRGESPSFLEGAKRMTIISSRPIAGGDKIGNVIEARGASTDTKPENCVEGSTFYEIDTKKLYVYDGSQWVEQ